MNALLFLLPAFTACLILIGIHTYLGIHIISRGVIFVDIALAQVAALGITLALLAGLEPESGAAYFFALGFTFIGALFFAFFRNHKIPQEAVVGVTFAVSSALSILIVSLVPHGSEHLKYVLSGNILWVSWSQIAKTAVIYLLLGLFHYRLRRPFLLVSQNPARARELGMKLRKWDLLFYLTFGLVITSSVQIAGVLLVFSFLIVPSLISMLFYENLRQRILLGWGVGIFTSLAGIGISFFWDLPTGPAIVALFGVVLFPILFIKQFLHKSD